MSDADTAAMQRVVVADDHEVVRRGVVGIVGDLLPDAHIRDVASVDALLELLREGHWDLLLLDIQLGDKNGLEALDDIRALQPDIDIIMLSVFAEPRVASACIRRGASAYVTKGAAVDHLQTALREVSEGRIYLSPDMAEKLKTQLAGRRNDLAPHEQLTERELQVFRLVAKGLPAKRIADKLSISEKTVATYRARIAEKSGLRTASEIIRYAMAYGLD
ncbi:response regulator [Lentisalinibacter salinarum]|uniref:response regulator n=1 Tax=Lentisalinibacter salinarum TaxID=2992239 RepID=UPI00386A7022